jgi:hypothetical protein
VATRNGTERDEAFEIYRIGTQFSVRINAAYADQTGIPEKCPETCCRLPGPSRE